MKRNCVWAFAISLAACISQPVPLFCQHNSANETGEGEPVYRVGKEIKPPRATYSPQPEYDHESRKAKTEGVVVLYMIVTKEGRPKDVAVMKSLTPRLDEQAIKTVSQWRFDPATKDGVPVAVKINVEVSFHVR